MSNVQARADWAHGHPAIVFSECTVCLHRWYLPRSHCPVCASPSFDEHAIAGNGRVVAVAALQRSAMESDDGDRVCLVDMEEGVRVMGLARVGLVPGDRVVVRFEIPVGADVPIGLAPFFERVEVCP